MNTANGVVAFKNRSTRINVLSVFFAAAPKSRSVYIGPRSTIHLSGPHKNIPHEFHVYLSPQTKPGCTSTTGRCDYQGIGVSNALWCGCKNCAGYWLLLLLVNPFSTSSWTRMDAERDKREARKNMYFERYCPIIFGMLMYGAVDKIKLGKTLFPNWRHILSQN